MASARLPRPRALWLQLRNVPILRMLQLEEALFRTDRRSWFITNEWDSAQPAAEALVLGISGRPEQMLHVEVAQRSGIPVIKRFTGGGTVVVDSDTLFASFIVAEGALPHVKPYPEPMLAWSGELYADALQRCGVRNFAVRANDYCLHADGVDLKFGGNAQSISGKRWLHHTSLLWDYAPARMALLQMPARQPEYRRQRPHESFVQGLGASFPCRDAFGRALVAAAGARFELEQVQIEEALPALEEKHRSVTCLVDLAATTAAPSGGDKSGTGPVP